jgi:hypothetical protein
MYETVIPIGTGFPLISQTLGPGDYDNLAPFGRGSQLSRGYGQSRR